MQNNINFDLAFIQLRKKLHKLAELTGCCYSYNVNTITIFYKEKELEFLPTDLFEKTIGKMVDVLTVGEVE